MSIFSRLTVKTKLVLTFVFLNIVILIIGILGYTSANRAGKNAENIFQQNLQPITSSSKLAELFERTRVNIRDVLIATSASRRQEFMNQTQILRSSTDKLVEEYEKRLSSEEERQIFTEYRNALQQYRNFRQQVYQQALNGDEIGAINNLQTQGPLLGTTVSQSLERLVEYNQRIAAKHKVETQELVSAASYTITSVIFIALGISILLAWLIVRSITKPMEQLMTVNHHLVNGDLSAIKIDISSTDEFGTLANAKKEVIHTLQEVIGEIRTLTDSAARGQLQTRANAHRFKGDYREILHGVNATLDSVVEPITETRRILETMSEGNFRTQMNGKYYGDYAQLQTTLNNTLYEINTVLSQVTFAVQQVDAGGKQVAAASTALSHGATQQAAALEEISGSMHEIVSQTKTSAENATLANTLATQSQSAATIGNTHMQELNAAMTEINASSVNIARIIKVIDEIAFQTNLLALNAAVEAARAGRHGKGFAVVAEEVRALAARSAKAARETAEMIESAVKTAHNGAEIAQETRKALDNIMMYSTKVQDIVAEIAAATEEQAQSIAQINIGLSQIDKVTQQNTASAEESASAAEELAGQSSELASIVSRFQLQASVLQPAQHKPRSFPVTRNGLHNADMNNHTVQNGNGQNKHTHSEYEHKRQEIAPQKMLTSQPKTSIALDDSEFGR
mgnify:CR=1 FL=1